VTVKDAAWPAAFQTLALAVTRGGQLVGKIYNGGTFYFDATPGHYLATFIATPATSQSPGLYSLDVQSTVPTVSLTVDQSSITAGQSVHLSWTSAAATGCTASGGWSGAQPTSGSGVAEGPLNANTTFTLTCSGPGGDSQPASVTVAVKPAPSSGGGSLDGFGLATLLALAACSARRRRAGSAAGVRR
jgi:hypothetical protein